MKMRNEAITARDRVRVSFATVKYGYRQTAPSSSFTLYDVKVPEVVKAFKVFLKEYVKKKRK